MDWYGQLNSNQRYDVTIQSVHVDLHDNDGHDGYDPLVADM